MEERLALEKENKGIEDCEAEKDALPCNAAAGVDADATQAIAAVTASAAGDDATVAMKPVEGDAPGSAEGGPAEGVATDNVESAPESGVEEQAAEELEDAACIVDAIGADNDDSGLDFVSVPVIGPEEAVGDEPGAASKSASTGEEDVDEQDAPKSHTARNVIIGIVVALVLVLGCFVGWLVLDDSRNAACHVPEGVTLDGTNIGGFTESEVQSVVTKHLVSGTAGSVTLKLSNGTNVELDYARMGDVDVPGTVEAAMATIEPSMVNRCVERVKGMLGMGTAPQKVELVTVCKLSKKRVKSKVQALSDAYTVEMQNAGYKFDRDKYEVVTTKARTGYAINIDATVKAILAASKSGVDEVQAADEVVEPTQTKPGQAIFVSLSECHLYFYVDGKVSRDYPCTPGMSGYETPSGDWTLSYKDPSPTWYNPHSDWSKNMPETIGPGASNPLGLRALEVSCGGGIYIHGTQNYAQLGSTGSHGCVRLANDNVVELFNLVETGIPIFIH